jgi:hypothetical protein
MEKNTVYNNRDLYKIYFSPQDWQQTSSTHHWTREIRLLVEVEVWGLSQINIVSAKFVPTFFLKPCSINTLNSLPELTSNNSRLPHSSCNRSPDPALLQD